MPGERIVRIANGQGFWGDSRGRARAPGRGRASRLPDARLPGRSHDVHPAEAEAARSARRVRHRLRRAGPADPPDASRQGDPGRRERRGREPSRVPRRAPRDRDGAGSARASHRRRSSATTSSTDSTTWSAPASRSGTSTTGARLDEIRERRRSPRTSTSARSPPPRPCARARTSSSPAGRRIRDSCSPRSCAEFGWKPDDWDLLAAGTVAGHIIECGAQCTGGNFTRWWEVSGWDRIGYPVVEARSDGTFVGDEARRDRRARDRGHGLGAARLRDGRRRTPTSRPTASPTSRRSGSRSRGRTASASRESADAPPPTRTRCRSRTSRATRRRGSSR